MGVGQQCSKTGGARETREREEVDMRAMSDMWGR